MFVTYMSTEQVSQIVQTLCVYKTMTTSAMLDALVAEDPALWASTTSETLDADLLLLEKNSKLILGARRYCSAPVSGWYLNSLAMMKNPTYNAPFVTLCPTAFSNASCGIPLSERTN